MFTYSTRKSLHSARFVVEEFVDGCYSQKRLAIELRHSCITDRQQMEV